MYMFAKNNLCLWSYEQRKKRNGCIVTYKYRNNPVIL